MKQFFRVFVAAFALSLIAAPNAFAFKITQANAQAMLDTFKAKPNSGTLVIYSGTQPANPDMALSGNTALATFTISATACGTDSWVSGDGAYECTMSFSSSSVTASATGTATFARMFESGGTTVDGDFTVGTSGADINLNSTSISSGGTVTLSSVKLEMPAD